MKQDKGASPDGDRATQQSRSPSVSAASAVSIPSAVDFEEMNDPAVIIADLLASTLMPRGGWGSARDVYCWEREGLDYLHARKMAGGRPPINAWTAMLVDEGYPAARAGSLCGKFWKPPAQGIVTATADETHSGSVPKG